MLVQPLPFGNLPLSYIRPVMIDTLKLSKRLQSAHMPAEQADALADGLVESLTDVHVTREFFDQRVAVLRSELDQRIAVLRNQLDPRIEALRSELERRIEALGSELERRGVVAGACGWPICALAVDARLQPGADRRRAGAAASHPLKEKRISKMGRIRFVGLVAPGAHPRPGAAPARGPEVSGEPDLDRRHDLKPQVH